ncbi:MAG: hypothetical protein AAFP92_23885, partial [Bacteroidota bacterium]
EQQTSDIVEHAPHCSHCQQKIQTWKSEQQLTQGWKALAPELLNPEAFKADLLARVKEKETPKVRPLAGWVSSLRYGMAAAAAFLLLFFIYEETSHSLDYTQLQPASAQSSVKAKMEAASRYWQSLPEKNRPSQTPELAPEPFDLQAKVLQKLREKYPDLYLELEKEIWEENPNQKPSAKS